MKRHFNVYIPAAIAICVAVSAAAALLLLGSVQAFGATSPDTSDDGSTVPRMAASYVQRKVIDKAKQGVSQACRYVNASRTPRQLDLILTADWPASKLAARECVLHGSGLGRASPPVHTRLGRGRRSDALIRRPLA